MKITIDVPESDVMSASKIGEEIARLAGWKIIEPDSNTVEYGFRFLNQNKGRHENEKGNYDVIADEIVWDSDMEHRTSLFDCDSPDYYGESLLEALDVSTLIWGEDEDENIVIYTE